MTLKNFRAIDFKKGKSDVEITSSTKDRYSEPVPTSKPIISPDASPEDVPSGTIPEILTWVGEDSERAKKALEAENADKKPRKGLVSQLEEIINA